MAKFNLIADLKRRQAKNGTIVQVSSGIAIGDNLGGSFYYNETSLAVPDNLNVVQAVQTDPTIAGRWIRVDEDRSAAKFLDLQNAINGKASKDDARSIAEDAVSLYGVSEMTDLKVLTLAAINQKVQAGDTLDVVVNKLQGQINAIASNNRSNWFQVVLTNGTGIVDVQGDSLIYGYDPNGSGSAINGATSLFKRSDTPAPEQLQVVIQQVGYTGITVVNKGYPGDGTKEGLTRWYNNVTFTDNVITSIPTPKTTTANAVILSYSFNDAADYGQHGYTLPLAGFKTNLIAMVLAELMVGKFLLLNRAIPPIAYANGLTSDTYKIEQYAAIIQEVADMFGLPFIDGREALQWLSPYTQADGIHYKKEAYNFMGINWATELLLPVPRKVCAGDKYYYYDRMIPNTTNITPIAYATKASTMMTLANGKNYHMIVDVIDRCELCVKSGGTSNFVISYGNGNSGIADYSVTTSTTTSLRKFTTGIILHPGKNIVVFKNASGASAFIDEIAFEPPTDVPTSRGKGVVPTDADYVVTSFALGTWFRLPVITANRNFSLPSASGREGEEIEILNLNTSGFAWNFLTTNLKTRANVTISTVSNGGVIKARSDGANWLQNN